MLTDFTFNASGELGVLGLRMGPCCGPGFSDIGLASLPDRDREELGQDLGEKPMREGLASGHSRPQRVAALD